MQPPQPPRFCSKMCTVFPHCKSNTWEGPTSSTLNWVQIRWGGVPGHYSVIFEAFSGQPISGILGCMWWSIVLHKDHGLSECCWLILVPLFEESVFQKLPIVLGIHFQSVCNLKGPASSSLIIVAPTTTSPPACWHLPRAGALCPLASQPWAQPSGPSRFTPISLVHKTFEKSDFMYFLAQSWCFSLWFVLSGGCVSASLPYQILWEPGIWHVWRLQGGCISGKWWHWRLMVPGGFILNFS